MSCFFDVVNLTQCKGLSNFVHPSMLSLSILLLKNTTTTVLHQNVIISLSFLYAFHGLLASKPSMTQFHNLGKQKGN
jgi:hypothetical protein